jgi:DNA (cytosine-5)-methyltransferase 1
MSEDCKGVECVKLTHFSLFSGIGGIDLAAEWAGFETVGQCEFADYPTKVLEKHWPYVPRWRDVRDVTAESIKKAGINDITLISGGFPCQPYSEAGQQKASADNRDLWPEAIRCVRELQPRWFVGENVRNFAKLGLDKAIFDLETAGYTARAAIYPACSIGAPHERNRLFLVAHSSGVRLPESYKHLEFMFKIKKSDPGTWNGRRLDKPGIQRVVDGVPAQMDRLKCLGNAVVPQQVYPILQAIADIERSLP